MEIIMYSTHCPKCNILAKKLESKNVEYQEITDVDLMLSKDISSVPMLEVDGELKNFAEAINWINKQ